MKALFLSIALALSTNVLAQPLQVLDTSQVSTALQVQRLAPQLVAFAGGDANFQNLVIGLATGAPVTLVNGAETVSFTPSGTMTATDIAQTLEKLRQQLIGRGIATPSAQQLATALAGGQLPTAVGVTQVPGVVSVQQSPAVAIQQQQRASSAASGGSTRSNVSDSPFPRGISDTPPATTPGVTTGASTGASSAAMSGATATTTVNTPGQAAIRVK
jgi:hypothetical protein